MDKKNGSTNIPKEQEKTRFNFRGFFSLLLFASFLLLSLSGIVLYIAPRCRIARETGWTVLGFDKEQWSAVHIILPLLVLIATGFHLYYNWGVFWGYIKRKTQGTLNLKLEMALALFLCVITILGTIYGIPPFSTIIQWNDDIKEYWESRSEEDISVAPPASSGSPEGGRGRGIGGGAGEGGRRGD